MTERGRRTDRAGQTSECVSSSREREREKERQRQRQRERESPSVRWRATTLHRSPCEEEEEALRKKQKRIDREIERSFFHLVSQEARVRRGPPGLPGCLQAGFPKPQAGQAGQAGQARLPPSEAAWGGSEDRPADAALRREVLQRQSREEPHSDSSLTAAAWCLV